MLMNLWEIHIPTGWGVRVGEEVHKCVLHGAWTEDEGSLTMTGQGRADATPTSALPRPVATPNLLDRSRSKELRERIFFLWVENDKVQDRVSGKLG